MFRHESLRHLRIEQFNRFFAFAGDSEVAVGPTLEDTLADEEDEIPPMEHHRHYDSFAQGVRSGTILHSSASAVPGVRRRKPARLAITRVPCIEPIGARREAFYEQKLLLGLAWYCSEPPFQAENGVQYWRFAWRPPAEDEVGTSLPSLELWLGEISESFEQRCSEIEAEFCRAAHNLVCECCAARFKEVCAACRFAVGFHRCQNAENCRRQYLRWRKGTLHAGSLDAERCLFNLYRKGVPFETLKTKADEYAAAGLFSTDAAERVCRTIEEEKGVTRIVNEQLGEAAHAGDGGVDEGRVSSRLSAAGLKKELELREQRMRDGSVAGSVTDQWRVYEYIVTQLSNGAPLRLMVQASAGTGKSYLLSTVYLWCIVHGFNCKAAAPTGIAAANVEVEGTDVTATTLHALLDGR